VLCEPEQHEGLSPGLGSTVQSDLQPTGKPVESNGPLREAGQSGPRSTGQSATWKPALDVTETGKLYPSTKDTS
jgi:hypothetical protein